MKDVTGLVEAASSYGELSETARAMAEGRNRARKYNVDFIPVLQERLKAYREECERNREPLTSGGFILASGVPSSTFYEMAEGKYDPVVEEWRLLHNVPPDVDEFIDEDGTVIPLAPFSDVIEKEARLPLQISLERNCYQNRGNPAGSIFGLKARFNWTEDPTPARVQNNLIIADSEQARRALEMLSR